jgi:hypothetical protein
MEALIRQEPWTPEAEARMRSPAAGNCITFLRAEVERGISQLWHFKDESDEAYCITRTDLNPRELVVCYFEGSGMRKFGRLVVQSAHAKGIPVRAHTSQPAVARLLRPLGLELDEMVLRSKPS